MLNKKRVNKIKELAFEVTKDKVSTHYSCVNSYDSFIRTREGIKLSSTSTFSGELYRAVETLTQEEIMYFLRNFRHYHRYIIQRLPYEQCYDV